MLLIFCCSLFIGIDRFTHRKKHRLSLSSISAANHAKTRAFIPALDPEEEKKVATIFNQSFSFFGKSHHAYLFLSEDHKYVLKFLKSRAFSPKSALAYLRLSFNPYYQDYLNKKEERSKTFAAYKLAFTELKEETGLIYMHIHSTNTLGKKITLYDKNGKALLVDLDKTSFYLQKRGQPIYPRLSELMRSGDEKGAQNIISSVFTLIEDLKRKGAIDHDLTLYKNFGIIDDKAVQLAISKLQIDYSQKALKKEEIISILNPFRRWIQRNYPQLLSHFDTELSKIS
jgi:hypothetical protein